MIAAWLSAFAAPGQVRAAVYEEAPLFASQSNPAVGPSIRQGVGPTFQPSHKWLGPQWSIGDFPGMQAAMGREIPAWMLAASQKMAPAGTSAPPAAPPQDLREYAPEWGDAFYSGRATVSCDHDSMLRQVKVPVLFTHHFHHVEPDIGQLLGAITDLQVQRVRQLIDATGHTFTCHAFPGMPHSMHGHAPAAYVDTITAWADDLANSPAPRTPSCAPWSGSQAQPAPQGLRSG